MSTGALLAVECKGSGPALVLLHPLATQRAIWAPLAPILADQFELYMVDLPGHGQSAPLADPNASLAAWGQALLATLDALHLSTMSILGISLGGMVAQAVALAAPGRVQSLVLAHTSAYTAEHGVAAWEQRLLAATAGGMQAIEEETLRRWFTVRFRERSPATMRWVGRMVRESSLTGYRRAVAAIQQLNYLPKLSEIAAPTLVIGGDCDAAVPVEHSRMIAECLPNGKLVVLSGAPHLSPIEQPGVFLETACQFLMETTLGA